MNSGVLNFYALIMLCAQVIAAVSQYLLKKSSSVEHESVIKAYLNPRVIGGYVLLAITMFMNVIAYRGLEYKVGVVITCTSYIFVMLVGRIFFGEKITRKKLLGNLLIIAGIVVFNIF